MRKQEGGVGPCEATGPAGGVNGYAQMGKFASTCLHSDAQNPIRGSALNITSPEMLYVSGSSGGQFEERARPLQGTREVVSAIVENAQAQTKTEKQ